MHTAADWGLKFVRWGSGLGIVGLILGYLPLGHYLMKDAIPSCPSAPVHGHGILLSFVGMTLFGLVYLAMPGWREAGGPPAKWMRMHFWLVVVGTIGVALNGTIGYEVLGIFAQPHFYYMGSAAQGVRNLWFAIDGVFLTVYGLGSAVFFYVLMKHSPAPGSIRP